MKTKPSKHNKNPQLHKTKAELLRDLKANPEFVKKMKFVRDEFYPALCEASASIDDATILLSGFNNAIMQEFLGLMKQKKVSELELYAKLDSENGKHAEFKKLLDLFQEMSVFEAKEYIEGMKQEIGQFQLDEARERPLSSLKSKWIDEL